MLLNILIIYSLFAMTIASLYFYLYYKYYMPSIVKNAPMSKRIGSYAMLWGATFLGAPYCLYEIIKIQRKGGFKK